MPDIAQTIAIIGSTPFAAVLAGLLAKDHSKQVVLVAERFNALRVQKTVSMPVAPVLRLDTWAMVQANWSAARTGILDIAPLAISRCDPVFAASGQDAVTALSHFKHLATGFDIVTEPLTPAPGDATMAIRLRDVDMIETATLAGAIEPWLTLHGVDRVDPNATVSINRDGSGRIDDRRIDRIVLADADALAAHYEPSQLYEAGSLHPMMAVLSAPAPRLAPPMVSRIDTGVDMIQRADGAVWITGPNTDGRFDGLIARALEPMPVLRSAARTRFTGFSAHDGAPLIGPLRQTRAIALCGLGALDMALAPMLARFIAGTASAHELDWCVARRPTRTMGSGSVAEFAPTMLQAA